MYHTLKAKILEWRDFKPEVEVPMIEYVFRRSSMAETMAVAALIALYPNKITPQLHLFNTVLHTHYDQMLHEFMEGVASNFFLSSEVMQTICENKRAFDPFWRRCKENLSDDAWACGRVRLLHVCGRILNRQQNRGIRCAHFDGPAQDRVLLISSIIAKLDMAIRLLEWPEGRDLLSGYVKEKGVSDLILQYYDTKSHQIVETKEILKEWLLRHLVQWQAKSRWFIEQRGTSSHYARCGRVTIERVTSNNWFLCFLDGLRKRKIGPFTQRGPSIHIVIGDSGFVPELVSDPNEYAMISLERDKDARAFDNGERIDESALPPRKRRRLV
jgi:hypothetical protein